MENILSCFKIAGKQFIAVQQYERSVMIVDDLGNNYGGWLCVENFKKNFTAGEKAKVAATVLGKCRLMVTHF